MFGGGRNWSFGLHASSKQIAMRRGNLLSRKKRRESASSVSRRLQNTSRNSVDLSGSEWTPVDASERRKSQRGNNTASEVRRH
jgi:hypothetical protein